MRTPLLVMSPWENILMLSGVRTMTLPAPRFLTTTPFFTSVTYTGLTVVVVVIVALPFIPGLSSWTVTCLSPTVKRKSAGTVNSRVPSAPFTTRTLPSTETISKDFTSVVVDWAWAVTAARARAPATATTAHRLRRALSIGALLLDGPGDGHVLGDDGQRLFDDLRAGELHAGAKLHRRELLAFDVEREPRRYLVLLVVPGREGHDDALG